MDTTFFDNIKIKDNVTIDVPRGQTYKINPVSGLRIAASGVHIRAVGSGAAPMIYFHGDQWANAFNIASSAKDVTIEGLVFSDMGSTNAGTTCDGTNVYLKNLGVLKGAGLGQSHGVNGLLVEDCYANQMVDRNFFITAMRQDSKTGAVTNNKNVTFRRVRCKGSRYEHGIRCHAMDNLLIDNCTLDNMASPQGKQALNLRDGSNHKVQNTVIRGTSVFGPLADANGGVSDPPSKERDRKLALRLKGLDILGVTQTGGWAILEAGITDFLFDRYCITSTKDGHVFEISAKYGTRDWAQGEMHNVKAAYTGGTGVFNTGHRDNIKFFSTTFNGTAFP